ncbi:MAG: HEAT repeat domain-containing protein [Acidobacteria bacterium]|nr:HEAT repeat domain-containing protein [Acidobacteriota bacterium]
MSPGPRLLLPAILVCAAVGAPSAQAQWQDVIRNLRHPKAAVRLEAVETLGNAGYVGAIEPVAPLVNDPDDRVQAAALEAELAFFLTERVSGGGARVLSLGGGRSRAQQAFEHGPLLRTATPAPPVLVDALIAAMRDENARVRFDAIHVLGFVAEPPLAAAQVAGVADGLDHYDPVMRMAAARVIGRLRLRDAAGKLTEALADSNATVRAFAVEAVGLLREEKALFTLRDLLERGRGDRATLLLAVARIAAPQDLALLRAELGDRQPFARRAAAEGLGRLADTESLPAIERLFKEDRSNEVRLAAAFALQRLGQTQSHVIASMLASEELRMQAWPYLFELGPDAAPGVRAALSSAVDSRYRADLIQMLGYLGTRDDVPLIEKFLVDRDQRLVRAATSATLRLRGR